MTVRAPLVVVAGQLRELPVGDSIARADSAGAAYDADLRRIVNPPGGKFVTSTDLILGAITIELPVGMSNTMMRVCIKVYEYQTNNSFELSVGGYNYVGGTWINPFAYLVSNPGVHRNLNVRFGQNAAGRAVIYIGELTSAWAYPQVFVTEAQLGFLSPGTDWLANWGVTFTATAFENVTESITGTQIGYGTVSATADVLVMRDANGDITTNALHAAIIQSVNPISFLNSGTAQGIKVGGVTVSDTYADDAPVNGIYSKGVIQSGVPDGTAPFTVISTTRVPHLNAATAGTADEAGWLLSEDNRTIKPSGIKNFAAELYFVSKGGLTGAGDGAYGDFLSLSSYNDPSGGAVNGLFFGKTTQEVVHFQAGFGATAWANAKTLAYKGDVVAASDVGPGPAQVQSNQHLGALAFMDGVGMLAPMAHRPTEARAIWFERASDTSISICMRGDDGVVRSSTLTLA